MLGVLGEVHAEFFFHSLNSLYLFHGAPLFSLIFEWPACFYTQEFFNQLFYLILTSEGCSYFCELIRQSDIDPETELGRLATLALDDLQTSPDLVLD